MKVEWADKYPRFSSHQDYKLTIFTVFIAQCLMFGCKKSTTSMTSHLISLKELQRRKDINNMIRKSRKTTTIFLVYTSPFLPLILNNVPHINAFVYHRQKDRKPLKSQHLIAYEDCGWKRKQAWVFIVRFAASNCCLFIAACQLRLGSKWVFNLIFKANRTERGGM